MPCRDHDGLSVDGLEQAVLSDCEVMQARNTGKQSTWAKKSLYAHVNKKSPNIEGL